MAWQHGTARRRIEALKNEVPHIEVQQYRDQYLPVYEARKAELFANQQDVSPPLVNLPKGQAVVVDTVQIYVNLTNYDDYRLDEVGGETEATHEQALRFLHLYYSASDRIVEQSQAQRVDFHGGRIHAVIMNDTGSGISESMIADALAFVRDFQAVARQANRQLANSQLTAEFRVGIDAGTCVAINNGTGLEQEPMFLGSAANHAAKLAAGSEPGIFISDRVRQPLGQMPLGILESEQSFDDTSIDQLIARHITSPVLGDGLISTRRDAEDIIESWRGQIAAKEVPDPSVPKFTFHYKEPPLAQIEYADLSPSNSIRMPLASIFADLSGFTDYVDSAIAAGGIADVVRALYVIRAELQNVVEEDFGGRKVRFIGDCIHAIIAEGTRQGTDAIESVTKSVECAGGLRSSFNICRELLDNIEDLGLAIGVEYGATPVSRIGIRGERSVRLASSVATTVSEKLQKECGENETKLGRNAMAILPVSLADLTDSSGVAAELTYDDVAMSASGIGTPAIVGHHARAHQHAPSTPSRAHFKTK